MSCNKVYGQVVRTTKRRTCFRGMLILVSLSGCRRPRFPGYDIFSGLGVQAGVGYPVRGVPARTVVLDRTCGDPLTFESLPKSWRALREGWRSLTLKMAFPANCRTAGRRWRVARGRRRGRWCQCLLVAAVRGGGVTLAAHINVVGERCFTGVSMGG